MDIEIPAVLAVCLLVVGATIILELPWTIPTTAIALLIVGLGYIRFERRHASSRTVALLGVIIAMIVVLRQIMHGIGASPVFFFVIITGFLFGPVNGFVVGSTVMLISNFFVGGQGPWTPFQMIALGLIGLFAGFLPKFKNQRLMLFQLISFGAVSAFIYGLITNIFFWMAFASEKTLKTYIGITSAGLPADIARSFGNIIFLLFFGPPVIKVLLRFRKRFFIEFDK